MASEQLMQEELQSSVIVSEADAYADLDDDSSAGALERAAQLGATQEDDNEYEEEEEEEEEMEDAEEGSDADEDGGGDKDEDVYESDSAAEDDEEHGEEAGMSRRGPRNDGSDEEEEEEEDSEKDEEEEVDSEEDEEDELDVDADVIEDAEGVGAVKIRPGETDDEEDSEASEASVEVSQSSDEDWDENADNADEEEDEEEGDEEVRGTPTCVFCKQDEEHGPSESVQAFLRCSVCAETAHAECAHEQGFTAVDRVPWKCADCRGHAGGDEMDIDEMAGAANGTTAQDGAGTPKATPVLRSVTANAESFSDQTDSITRSLRKRRTSPVEAEEGGMSLRKRRQRTSDELNGEGLRRTPDVTTTPSSSRSLRPKSASSLLVTVEKRTRTSIVLKMRVSGAELRKIFTRRRKYTRKVPNKMDKAVLSEAVHVGMGGGAPLVLPNTYIQPFYSFFDKETEELKGKPYGGILNENEADTTRTFPAAEDRRKFGEAKRQAEEDRQIRLLTSQMEAEVPKKRAKKALEPASQIECIEFGGWEIGTWYAAPYPEEYSRNQVLYICEFCLKYMNSDYVAWRHKLKCPAKHPPGDEIYRHGSVSVFEVDGRKNPVYCQNLCLLAKLFLGSKTLYYDVEPFLFYVLCEYDELGYHFVGYFSKEKRASSQNNVSCILTLPIHQRKGYGNLLIDFSYLLTRVEKKTGSPEKPLSDMGLVSYRNYWRLMMCRYLLAAMKRASKDGLGLSIRHISDETGMTADDVISALEGLRCLVRDPQTGLYAFRVDVPYCREYVAKWEAKGYVKLNPEALTWTPYVMGRGNATNFELAPALTAIAPRDEDEEAKPADALLAQLVNGDVGAAKVNGDGMEVEEAEATAVEAGTAAESHEGAVKQDEVQADTATEGRGSAGDGEPAGLNGQTTANQPAEEYADWRAPYAEVPATRFVVFPPVSTRRFNYARTTLGRPPGSSRVMHGPRGRSRYGAASARRSSASRPKTSATRKKTGGTGRGPGRWPKGTKKSDYGNADSGPGLPPAWIAERQAREAAAAAAAAAAAEAAAAAQAAEAETNETTEAGVVEAEAAGAAEAVGAGVYGGAVQGVEEAVAVAIAVSTDSSGKKDSADEPMVEDTVQVQTPPAKLRSGMHTSVFGRGRSSPRLGRRLQAESEDTVMVGGKEK